MVLKPRNPWKPQGLEELREHSTLGPSEGVCACLSLGFGLLVSRALENTFVLFSASQFVLIYYGSPRKGVQVPRRQKPHSSKDKRRVFSILLEF